MVSPRRQLDFFRLTQIVVLGGNDAPGVSRRARCVFVAQDAGVSQRCSLRIGLLFSVTGPYRTIGTAMRNGALLATEQVNADATFPFCLELVGHDPGGRNADYAAAARRMLVEQGLVHIVGCYTSSSRKEVLPLFEKHDGLLWYPRTMRASRAATTSSTPVRHPNQHIVPLAEHPAAPLRHQRLLPGLELHLGLGEQQDHARGRAGGRRHRAGRALRPGRRARPRRHRRADPRLPPELHLQYPDRRSRLRLLPRHPQRAGKQGIDQSRTMPVASCSLAEPELVEIGAEAAAGH